MNLEQAMVGERLATARPSREATPFVANTLTTSQLAQTVTKSPAHQRIWEKKQVSSEFVLMQIPIGAVATLPSLESRIMAGAEKHVDAPIVVDINQKSLGRTGCGFTPKVIVTEGAERHKFKVQSGVRTILAWVGASAMKYIKTVMADDQFGAGELREQLSKLIQEKVNPSSDIPGVDRKYVSIQEVYPFENYVIYSCSGKYYRQAYKANSKKRTVTLDGDPEEVVSKYVDVKAMGPMSNMKVGAPVAVTPNPSSGSGVGPRITMRSKADELKSKAGRVKKIVTGKHPADCDCDKCKDKVSAGGPGSGRKPGSLLKEPTSEQLKKVRPAEGKYGTESNPKEQQRLMKELNEWKSKHFGSGGQTQSPRLGVYDSPRSSSTSSLMNIPMSKLRGGK